MAYFDTKKNSNSVIGDKAYYFTVAATLFFGFAINAVEVIFFADVIKTFNPIVFFVIYFVSAFAGVLINVLSEQPALSFLGYMLVVLPLGMLLSIVVPEANFVAVRSAFLVTALLTAIFSIFAITYPKFFQSFFAVLSLALTIAVIYQIFAIFLPIGGRYLAGNTFLDWLIVIIFSCYIGYDMWLATKRQKTLDSAIDAACGLYLNIVNLFVWLLAVFSRRR